MLGRKWSLRVLADIGYRGLNRFGQILRSNPGLTPRVLSRRLRELESAGMVRKRVGPSSRDVTWSLTEQGTDALPAVMTLLVYGSRWNGPYRFDGRLPEPLSRRTGPR